MGSSETDCGIADLHPAVVWTLFSQIAAIPRPSKKEERICKGVRSIAKELNLAVREDHVGNLVIDVPASPGCESAPITVLQGHLDMVCEKNAGCSHDFLNDPIRLIVDRDRETKEQIVRADGTTLGADNGVGLAMALAAASSPDVIHGPLELLFTVDEETGMTGAMALTPDSFRGRRLLNLDSEEDDVIYIGCAGGCDATLTFDCKLQPPGDDAVACRVVVSGLRGGHSGGDIHENRGNAIRILVRVLLRAHPETMHLATIRGGNLRNAIAREAEAVLAGPSDTPEVLQAAAKTIAGEVAHDMDEPGLAIRVESVDAGEVRAILSTTDSWRIIATLAALPHGVLGMDPAIKGLVETSNNVATVTSSFADGQSNLKVEIGSLARSSSEARKRAALGQIAAVGKLAGAAFRTANDYPGWAPNIQSPTLTTCRTVYRELFGEEPTVTAIHAGLECGIIGERVGKMDMVSFGPKIMGPHSPDERVYVDSVGKSWRYLQAVLAELART